MTMFGSGRQWCAQHDSNRLRATGPDLSIDEKLSSSFEPCLGNIFLPGRVIVDVWFGDQIKVSSIKSLVSLRRPEDKVITA